MTRPQRVLFVCSQNKLRSPTAEQVFSQVEGIEADSGGIASDAVTPLGADQIAWADTIFVMERSHRSKLSRRFKSQLVGKRVVVLNIPDEFDYMDEKLVELLKARVTHHLR